MNSSAHLWAVAYDDVDRARQVREVIASLAGPGLSLQLLDIAILVRLPDGSLMFDGKPFSARSHVFHHGPLGILAGFALAVPLLSDEAVTRLFDSIAPDGSDALGINQKFKQDIASMMRPGTSALLVLVVAQNVTAILNRLRGLGGTILKTNVNVELASLIQSTLAAELSAG